MRRYTGRLDWKQLGLVKRSEKIDTRLMLLIVDACKRLEGVYTEDQLAELFAPPVQGGVSYVDRLREGLAVAAFWDSGMLQAALEFDAHWHALVEPARDENTTWEQAAQFVSDFLLRKHRWPTVGETRKFLGRPSNHRLPGEQEGQGTLSLSA